jgi:hypothetical protein
MIKFFKDHFISRKISKKEATDTGMAITLIFLMLGYFTKNNMYYLAAIPVLVINMAFPMFYYPFAIIWFGITGLLGEVISKVLLSVVYIVVLMPIGIIRRMMGKDAMLLKSFKKDNSSVMVTRNHEFTSNDIVNPY